MSTNINFNKKLGISGGTNIILPSGSAPVPTFADTKSFQFDGITDRFIGVGNYSELDGQNKMTISGWINLDSTSNSGSYLCGVDGGSLFSFGIRLQTTTNTTCWVYVNNSGNNNRVSTNLGAIKNTGWHHLMICLDLSLPNASECQIFFDGISQTMSGYFADTTFPNATSGLTIGASSLGYLGGNVNEFAIWSGSDQRANVSEIYNGGYPNDLNNLPTAPQPTTWQRMGEDVLWNGFAFTMTDVNGGYVNRGIGLNASDPNPTTDVPLFDNKSFTYDGVSDYVDLGTNANLIFLGARSMSVWLKFTDNGSTRFVANFNSDQQGMYTNSGKVYFFNRDASFTWKSIATINTYNDNQWHNFIGINDGTNLKMYANGVLVNSNTDGSVGNTNSYIQRIGARWNGLTAYSGLMNDLSYFDNDQSANALTIYNGGIANDISNLNPLSYWRSEFANWDGSNWTMIDQGSGSNNGTSVSMPLTSRTSDVPT